MNQDARGNITQEQLGNGEVVTRTFDDQMGYLMQIDANGLLGLSTQALALTYDELGNLNSRNDQREGHNLQESFCYDNLNRLVKVNANTVIASCGGYDHTNGDIQYDSFGNITDKVGVGAYVYGQNGAGPHAVTNAGGTSYLYDSNGNMTSGDGRSLDYSTFDKATNIIKGSDSSAFSYGVSRSRYKRIDTINNAITTTWYLGDTEIIDRPDGSREMKTSIGGRAMVTHLVDGNGDITQSTNTYFLKDHLGSIIAVMDQVGNVIQDMSFDAWGQRRGTSLWTSNLGIYLPTFDVTNTTRGFTGHETVDAVGLVHMNGRIYDAKLGRFLQADPNIDGATNTQGFNRYSYVHNNPLNATDPSGYFSLRKWVGAIVGIAGAAICGPSCASFGWKAFALGAASGAAGAAANGGNILQGALLGGVSGAAFGGVVGGDFAGFGSFAGAARFGAFGFVGGTTSVLSGGKFGRGFMSAGIGGSTTGGVGGTTGQIIGRTIVKMVVSGTVSKLTGGKFANGAVYSAFSSIVSEGVAAFKKNQPLDHNVTQKRNGLTYLSMEDSEAYLSNSLLVADVNYWKVAGGLGTITLSTLTFAGCEIVTAGGCTAALPLYTASVALGANTLLEGVSGIKAMQTGLQYMGLSADAADRVVFGAEVATFIAGSAPNLLSRAAQVSSTGSLPLSAANKLDDFRIMRDAGLTGAGQKE